MTSDDDRFDSGRLDAEVFNLDEARGRRDAPAQPDVDNDPDDGPVLVDGAEVQRRPPRFTVADLREGERRPIVPGWLRSRAELWGTARWAAEYSAHTGLYHLTRSPKYAGRLAARSPRGAFRVVGGFLRWLFDLEGEAVRQATVRTESAEEYLKLARLRDRRVRWRGFVAVFTLAALFTGTGVVLLSDESVQWAVLAGLVVVLGVVGAPQDKPLLDTAVVKARVSPLTSDVVVRALSVLGLAGITQALAKNPKAIGFPAPITRDGPGWRADVELPPGVTVGEVADRRAKLASGLGRPLGCVWPEGNAEVHPGRLVLWVGDQDMSKARQPAWPLLRQGSVDLFSPQPFGTDQRGRWVSVTFMFTSVAIGAVPRMGKTFALRESLLIGALDPRAEIHAYDLKGTGDLSPLEAVAHRYRAGDEDDDIAYALADLRAVREELRRRTKVVRGLPRDICPENKVTPELAGKRSLGLQPIVVGCDECQVWFEHPAHGAEFEEICTDLVKRGPALGIILILATQRPDARSLPTGISANVSTRFCLRVMGQVENDMVLGTSMYRNGVRATMFSRRDIGIGYLVGEGDDPRIVRTVYLDAPTAERIALRARGQRERAGTLTGHALGEQSDTEPATTYNVLDDILAVVPDTETRVWNETVVARLAELRPAAYEGWQPEQLTSALKPYRVRVDQVGRRIDGKTVNRRGITRAHIVDAVTERNRKRNAG